MEWRDQGILLSVRKHGESSVIAEVFTEHHGRHYGVVRGGTSRKIAPVLQPGNQIDVHWRARLEDQLGAFTVEPIRSRSAALSDRIALAGLNATTALLHAALPEREKHHPLYIRSVTLMDLTAHPQAFPLAFLRWELTLLEDLGFGLDLTRCAVTGDMDDLAYVSPRTGRAVSAEGAGEWAPKLLPLPQCLLGQGPTTDSEILTGLALPGYFLEKHPAHALGDRPLPEARARFLDLLQRQMPAS
ncbi:MAG: DNA repair protein RecO [Pseudomonadota bacterium]|nr:DNA repair protein RecO [Pseudomonadota bacterium]